MFPGFFPQTLSGQENGENGAFTRYAFNLDTSAMALDDRLYGRESYSIAFPMVFASAPMEDIENKGGLGGIYSDPPIDYSHDEPHRGLFRFYRDGPAILRSRTSGW